MKKTLFLLLAFAASMSINAQVMKLLKGNEVVATYSVDQVDKVVFQKDQTPTTGTATRIGISEPIEVKWIQLWEDGPKFAEYNVGAENNKAEDYGGYYCWGSSIDKDPNETYKTGSTPLSGLDDTATNLWGDNWRMPTNNEFHNLLYFYCDVEWTDNYNNTGKAGCVFRGQGDYSGNSIFLPAAGYYHPDIVENQGNDGEYWSSTNASTIAGFGLLVGPTTDDIFTGNIPRKRGVSVRAVLKE